MRPAVGTVYGERPVPENLFCFQPIAPNRGVKEFFVARHKRGRRRQFWKVGVRVRKVHHKRPRVFCRNPEAGSRKFSGVNFFRVFDAVHLHAGGRAGFRVQRAPERKNKVRGRHGPVFFGRPLRVGTQVERKARFVGICLPRFGNSGLRFIVGIQTHQPFKQRRDDDEGRGVRGNLRVKRLRVRRKAVVNGLSGIFSFARAAGRSGESHHNGKQQHRGFFYLHRNSP